MMKSKGPKSKADKSPEPPQAPPELMGYARVSTDDQDLSLQVDALRKFGVKDQHIYREKASGGRMDRKVLQLLIKEAHPGDTLVVWKLDRLGRTLMGVLEVIEFLASREVEVVSLTEPVDTRSAMGKAFLQISLVFAELERNLISERTKAGMAVRRAAGKRFGKRHAILDRPKRLARWRELYESGELDDMTVQDIIDDLNAVDTKAAKITSQETYRKWRREGFRGALQDEPITDDDEAK